MFDKAVSFLCDEVNVHLKKRTGDVGNVIEVGAIADDQGKWAFAEGLRLSLVNIEEERVMKSQVPERRLVGGHHVTLQPEVKLNLVLMFAARLKVYGDSLRYLSQVMTFFQANPSFNSGDRPGLDRRIDKLNVELLSYGPEQLNQLWAYLGTKYLPSVLYRVRLIRLQDEEPEGVGRPISVIETTLHDR